MWACDYITVPPSPRSASAAMTSNPVGSCLPGCLSWFTYLDCVFVWSSRLTTQTMINMYKKPLYTYKISAVLVIHKCSDSSKELVIRVIYWGIRITRIEMKIVDGLLCPDLSSILNRNVLDHIKHSERNHGLIYFDANTIYRGWPKTLENCFFFALLTSRVRKTLIKQNTNIFRIGN